MPSQSSFDAIIVGAGVSGLVAAIELSRAGLKTAVVDKAKEVGGRVQSDNCDGFILDRGFQVLLTAYPEAKRYLDYEKLDLRRFPRGASIITNDGVVDLTDPRENMTAAIKSFGKVLHAKDLPGLWRLSKVSGEPDPGDQSSTAEYLANAGFSDSLQTAFLEPFLRGILLDDELSAPIQNVSFYMEMFAKGHAAVPARGMNQISLQLAEKAADCEFLLGREVAAIEAGCIRFADGASVSGDNLILALDPYHAGQLTGLDCPASFHGTTCHYYDAPSADVEGLMPLALNGCGGPVNHLSIPTIASDCYAPPGRALVGVNLMGEKARTPQSEVELQLKHWFGDRFYDWRHLRSVTIDQALPSQRDQDAWHKFGAAITLVAATRFAGPTAVAGDFTATASLNGAMASGAQAAAKVSNAPREAATA